ncbi:Eco57I restriction-modification methylase domain-containing protein [Microbacterium sp. NC79]|uniref:Eco57I restriction-modification methylase domain-containing protein n=1 Tax=Microbacterium sp. NC79 TaxID=2851009 RepID=UPI001C2BFE42|nr:Eco57I restriction-modification methylase domain-containing protein [Microbacterium sp. NC79]MBV0896096.1 Eco57I restriction-modification methylase domain-containing protein [Microbacterium sp. NC79]
MAKKFDVVIGNPPYQGESTGDATHAMPIYHQFMEAAYEVGTKVVLITPARFLFNAGYTPKAWNEKMLRDSHLSVPYYAPNSDALFPGTDIKGGIAVTFRDSERQGEPIGTFTKFPDLNDILHRVQGKAGDSLAGLITSSRSYAYTDTMHEAHPNAAAAMATGEQYKMNTKTFELLPQIYSEQKPADGHDYVQVLGLINNKRVRRWIRKDYIAGPANFDAYKVVLSAAYGAGNFGETLASPHVIGPEVAVTQSFATIGCFDNAADADACLKYVKTKFARTLLGVLKITQHAPAKVWKHVPLQDFSADSDIDWTKSIAEIDEQLFAKYELTPEDIDFIETQIKPME